MFWNYVLFEIKLLLHNKKNLFLGLVLLLFFPIFFIYFSQTQTIALKDHKKIEANMTKSIIKQFPETQRETDEGEEIYQSLLQQSSLVNYQIFYLHIGESSEDYIENGLALNQLRLRTYELNNEGIPEHLIIPMEEILKEDALLHYLQEHKLPLQPDPFVASHYLVAALTALSGLLFYLFVLLSGSELLVNEQRHRTVVSGYPLSFMKKITIKVGIHFIQIIAFLVMGLLLGGLYVSKKTGLGDFSYPVLIYKNEGYAAISTSHYLLYAFLAMALITILILYVSVLLNLFFQNAYANILIGLGLFLLPDLFMLMDVKANLLNPIKYVDFSNVLSGALSKQWNNDQIDYWHAVVWLAALSLLMISIVYSKNKFRYIRGK